MKRSISFLLLQLCALTLFCQQLSPEVKRCSTFESLQDFRSKHPGAETEAQFEKWLQQNMLIRSTQRIASTTYTIPIVFHIVTNGEAVGTGSNISAAQIQQQLNQLNADFANLSGSTYGVASTMDIQFCLAIVAPDGTPLAEPGIDRVDRNARSWNAGPYDGQLSNSYVDQTIIPGSIWDPYKYFNVWTMDLSGSLLGKATFPTGSTLAGLGSGETDTHAGVFVHYKAVGSVSSPGIFGSNYGLGRTLTHEAGHFFGLRHIWGDATCGNDYCNDTPPQDAATSGCPATGTLNNCTPSQPKMFENYMDYTNDPCVNTFTADQKTRMMAVMTNSPRRKELITANTCTPELSNAIRFGSPTATVSEAATVTSCPRYRDVIINLNVYTGATGNATVTFTKSGTATDNTDYIVFPSFVTYINGDNTSKSVTIRIWDDAAVEPTETLVLGYTISGAGVVAGSANQTFTVTITDDDAVPIVNNSGRVELLNENFGTSGGTLPAGWFSGSFISPVGINQWVVSSNGGADVSGQCAHITNNTSAKPNVYTDTVTSDAALITKQINATGYNNLKLSFKYKCNGEYDAYGAYDYGTLIYSLNGSSFYTLPNAATGGGYSLKGITTMTDLNAQAMPTALSNTNFYLGFRWMNDNSVGSNPGLTIDDVVLYVDAAKVESTISQNGTENIFSGQEVYLKSGAGNVLAKIKNPSEDVGCLTATISQAGTQTATISTDAGTYTRTEKVIQLSPATPNNTAAYEATFYFSTAELAAFGSDKLNLKLLKVRDGVSLNGLISSTDYQLVNPSSVYENAAGGYITYSGNFTGFSQFMLVSSNITLPVTFLSFDAQPVKNDIALTWRVADEKNNKGFMVERSLNGFAYTKIGWVDGKNIPAAAQTYQFTDGQVQPNTKYFYRLRQVDENGKETFSAISSAQIAKTPLQVSVNPNPATDFINLFITGATGRADVQLIDGLGKTVRSWQNIDASLNKHTFSVTGLSKGVYSMFILLPNEKLVQKVILGE